MISFQRYLYESVRMYLGFFKTLLFDSRRMSSVALAKFSRLKVLYLWKFVNFSLSCFSSPVELTDFDMSLGTSSSLVTL